MVYYICLFILGFILLIGGADVLVDGSSSIARKLGISTFVIGLTVVAFGTSMPEMVVSVVAALRGSTGIALGNIIGSNIANTLLVLGVAAVIAPLLVKRTTVTREIPFSLLAVLAVGFLANDSLLDHVMPNSLTRIDGLILILFFSIFIYYTFGIAKSDENIFQKTVGELKEEHPKELGNIKAVAMMIFGLAGLVVGGDWIVSSAVVFAQTLGVSQALIGLTIVAVGTSLPELAASSVAAYKGRADLAVGNVIGSNIFNLLWVLGISAVISPIAYDPALNADMLILIGVTVLMLFLIFLGRKNILARREGAVLIGLYILYLLFIIHRG